MRGNVILAKRPFHCGAGAFAMTLLKVARIISIRSFILQVGASLADAFLATHFRSAKISGCSGTLL